MLALRWVLAAPNEALSARRCSQRQDLLVEVSQDIAELAKQAGERWRRKLASSAARTDGRPTRRANAAACRARQVSAEQEVIFNLMALERVPAEFAFPPLTTPKDIQAAFPTAR